MFKKPVLRLGSTMRTTTSVWCSIGLALLLIAAAHRVDAAAPVRLFVAANGNDAWSGALPEPNAAGTDGPLATITGARDALRKLKAANGLAAGAQVLIRGGSYFVTEPVVFGPDDSAAPVAPGTDAAPISYEAYPNEQPVIHGGRVLKGWRQEGNLWTIEIPEAREGKWAFGALWVNGERRTPARVPNATHPAGDYPTDADFFYAAGPVIEKDPNTGAEGKSATKFQYRPGDLKPWPSLADAVVVVFHSWETSLLRVKGLDEANQVIEFTGPAAWPFGYWRGDQWYFVENLFEALDQPGEWFLNKQAGKLYYMPMPNEDMAKAEAVAPVARQLVLLKGSPADGKFVEHLNFRGLRFHYTDYPIEPQGHSDSQAAFGVPAAFEATGARKCLIERCEVAHVGTYGVWFRAGCQDNRLAHCEVFDLGAGGVRIGEGGNPTSPNEAAARNVVDNTFIHDGGRIFRGAVGVWIGRSSENTLSHNEICDFRYTGVSVGWSWGYDATSANHNVIEFNNVHHVGKGQLSDMGGIYTLGISPGTVIRNNVFHDCLSNPRVSGGWGIYFDEGSTEILAENNLVYNTLTGGLHQHYGRENRVVNNIFAFSHNAQLVRSREEEHLSFFFERNIVYFNNGQLLGSTWRNGNFRMDNNCYWDTASGADGPAELDFAGRTWDEWKAAGFDVHSTIADPLFVNPDAADFRLKPDSPALALGFKPFDVGQVGLYGEPEWTAKPARIVREGFAAPKPPPPQTISDAFDETPVDTVAANANTLGEEAAARIRVSDETAASGAHSLKFTDAPGLQHAFNPHLVYSPSLRRGLAVAGFALRAEPGAVVYHEWRDNKNPYRIGPSVWINAAGELTVQGKTLVTIPHSQWVRIEMECPLGKDANGAFTLTVTLPGQPPQRFETLPCGSPEFRRLDWFGFVSNAQENVVFYLDDVKLALK